MWARVACALLLLCSVIDSAHAGRLPPPSAEVLKARSAGEALYRLGILPSGGTLTGERGEGAPAAGAAAACVNCHGRSGLGEADGSVRIPPITGSFLFAPISQGSMDPRLPHIDGLLDRPAYNLESFARALREGIDAQGRTLSSLMPRFSVSGSDVRDLSEYLKSLTPPTLPGVERGLVQFATIVTPDADGAKRAAMLAVLNQYFADQNEFARVQTEANAQQPLSKRRWKLFVWHLTGPPSSWEAQLERLRAQQPVYAVLAGLGGSDWAPVHRFCEKSALPCLFPNVDLPVVAEHDFYSVYFSRGVLLEADLMESALVNSKRVVQVYREGDVGTAAAAAVHRKLAARGIEVLDHPLPARAAIASLASLVRGLGPQDALVLWLRDADLTALNQVRVPHATVVASGIMAGMDKAPLNSAWRGVAHLSYPVDLPARRAPRVQYALGWMALHHIAVSAEPVQVNTYVACSAILEMLNHMHGAFPPDYLIERLEAMLEHQLVTGYYPQLALAPNERFASKGGYLVRFADGRVIPDTDWVVP